MIHTTTKGTKLVAVRDRQGKFKDIQTYTRKTSEEDNLKSRLISPRANPRNANRIRALTLEGTGFFITRNKHTALSVYEFARQLVGEFGKATLSNRRAAKYSRSRLYTVKWSVIVPKHVVNALLTIAVDRACNRSQDC